MIDERKSYYHKMLIKNRVWSIVVGSRFAGFITFYITTDEHKFDNVDPWEVLEDEPSGDICYIAQMVTDNDPNNKRLSFRALGGFIAYIKQKFPNVRRIFWRRWNRHKKEVDVFKKEI